MAIERGMPSLPRNLGRELRVYLQGLHSVVASLAGLARNSQPSRAVRYTDESVSTNSGPAKLTAGQVSNAYLATGAVTTEKLIDGGVTEPKLADKAVSARKLQDGAVGAAALADKTVTTAKLADRAVNGNKLANAAVGSAQIKGGAVTFDKLAEDVMPVTVQGTAKHGQSVNLGEWLEPPHVAVVGFAIPVSVTIDIPAGEDALTVESNGTVRARIDNLREENGDWLFDATACYDKGKDAEGNPVLVAGEIFWSVTGRRENEDAG